MVAGDNTLNTLCARVLLRDMVKNKGFNSQSFLREYVAFMTTPGTHRDTYAESFHREFFKNFSQGKKEISNYVSFMFLFQYLQTELS